MRARVGRPGKSDPERARAAARALSRKETETGLGRASALRLSGARESHDRHAHFRCVGCGKAVRSCGGAPQRVTLPRGLRSERVESTMQGRCAACA